MVSRDNRHFGLELADEEGVPLCRRPRHGVRHGVLTHWSAATNGPRTFFGISAVTTLWLVAGCAIAALLAAIGFKGSRAGQLLRANRDDEATAAALGIHISRMRWTGFVIAAFFADWAAPCGGIS